MDNSLGITEELVWDRNMKREVSSPGSSLTLSDAFL